MSFSFTLIDTIPATPRQIYDAWLDSRGHTAMTGSAAEASGNRGCIFHRLGRLHYRSQPDPGAEPANCAVVAHDQVHRE